MIIINKSTNIKGDALRMNVSKTYLLFIPDEYFCYGYDTKKSSLILTHFFINMNVDGVENIYDKKDYEKIYKFKNHWSKYC